jgi:pyrroloquinoline quinone biosynthesis protein A
MAGHLAGVERTCPYLRRLEGVSEAPTCSHGGKPMQWTTPSFTDMRFGFEITMYIATR